jgi:hypothetical protein
MHVGSGVDVGFRRLEVGWLESRGPEKMSQRRARPRASSSTIATSSGFD